MLRHIQIYRERRWNSLKTWAFVEKTLQKKVLASGFDFSSYTSRIGKSTDIQYLSRNADTGVEKLALWSMFLPAILAQSLLNLLLY